MVGIQNAWSVMCNIPAWSRNINDFHSSCILFSPPGAPSQQASIEPSGVGQHRPDMPIAAHPKRQEKLSEKVSVERFQRKNVRENV